MSIMLRMRRDEGMALAMTVIFTAGIMTLTAVAFSVTRSSLGSARNHISFEQALSVSEAGVDQSLARLQTAYNLAPGIGDYPVPAPSHACSGATLQAGASFVTPQAERTWARTQLNALGNRPECRQTIGGGEFAVLKPTDRQAVYVLSSVPRFGVNGAKQRLLKAEYLFSPYRPSNAVLTGGDLCISGSVSITTLDASTPANVHANSGLRTSCNSGTGSGSSSVAGTVTASGAYEVNSNTNVGAGSGGGAPKQTMPTVSPRSIYNAQSGKAEYSNLWFDLCPDGRVMRPTAPAAPCSSTDPTKLLQTLASGGSYEGWTYSAAASPSEAPVWAMNTPNSPYQGVYYVYQGDAVIGSNGGSSGSDFWHATVLAESLQTGAVTASCGKIGGNINWRLHNIRNKMPGIVFVAEADLIGSANSRAETGLFVAGDQISFNTSSGSLRGAVIAGDACPNASHPNTMQGFSIEFDGGLEAPVSSIIRTTLWLEYIG